MATDPVTIPAIAGSLAGSSAVATLSMLSWNDALSAAKLFAIFGTFGFIMSLLFIIHISFTKKEHLSLKETLGRAFLAFSVSSMSGVTAFYYLGDALPAVVISAASGFFAERIMYLIPSLINGIYYKIFGIELSNKDKKNLEMTKNEEMDLKKILLEHLEKQDFMMVFYDFLFVQEPTLKEKFTMDDEERNRQVKLMLRLIIVYMDRIDDEYLTTTLKPTACRHAEKYGARAEDYLYFGIALIETLEYFGVNFNNKSRKKFMQKYEKISYLMQNLGNL